MNDQTRWWAEWGLDVLFTFIVGWCVLGTIAANMLQPALVGGEEPGEIAKAMPVLAQCAVTYGIWKLARSFNWLKGVPPKG